MRYFGGPSLLVCTNARASAAVSMQFGCKEAVTLNTLQTRVLRHTQLPPISMTDAEQRRHGTFWFADGNIVLQAEQTLFKVHREFLLQESAYFQGMFALPRSTKACDGTEEQPYFLLEAIAADTLANIFTMMYTICGLEPSFDVEQLVDMLCVCDRLQFGNISTVVHRK
ncbi:hypothetical protein EXIGLDRAFT_792420, partial [Exidia glandulosa HHB12029]